jgi:dihydroorotate dehydrogenase
MIWNILKPIFFSLDAENAHDLASATLENLEKTGCSALLRSLSGTQTSDLVFNNPFSKNVLGKTFLSPIGLAAGFDKNAKLLSALPYLGFGFAEIGTVTPKPQIGNPKPRLFRFPEKKALFNQMGFNNDGSAIISARISKTRENLPEGFRIGVNIGKNKDTELNIAWKDYRDALIPFAELADYVVINVSSPNTPGLRSLQTIESLKPIIQEVKNVLACWKRPTPLLLKLASEVLELNELIPECEKLGIQGWILTNTLQGELNGTIGGWSGLPLADESYSALLRAKSLTSNPIISVGGISSAKEARRRFEAGASLIQLYTGWIYEGPTLVKEIKKSLK